MSNLKLGCPTRSKKKISSKKSEPFSKVLPFLETNQRKIKFPQRLKRFSGFGAPGDLYHYI
jgi:hypothetical protein